MAYGQSTVRQRRATAIAAVLTWGLLAVLLPIAVGSYQLGILAAAGVAGLTLIMAVGLEKTAIVLFFIGFVLAPMDRIRPVPSVDIVAASDLVMFVAVFVLLPVLIKRPFKIQALFAFAVASFAVCALIASVANPAPIVSLFSVVRFMVGAISLPILFAWWRPRPEVVPAFALAYVGGACISIAEGRLSGVSGSGRFYGLTMHPNILGLCSLLALALIPFLLTRLPSWTRPFLAFAAAFCAYGVWISGSRAALVVALGTCALYVLLAKSVSVVLMSFGLSIVPIYAVASAIARGEQGPNALGRLLGNIYSTPSDIEREMLRAEAIANLRGNPLFGVGFGDVLEAHNVYLQIAAAGGIITGAVFILLMAATVRQGMLVSSSNLFLALPAISYVVIAPLTSLVWDRYIWSVLALPFLLPMVAEARAKTADEIDVGVDQAATATGTSVG